MRVLLGLHFGGATLAEPDGCSADVASIGRATWGPAQLLGDLELRLGLQVKAEPQAVRVASWQARIAQVCGYGRYYSRSFEVEPLGVARDLLHLRDALVEAGWDGRAVVGGGRRLDALAELEQLSAPPLPLGRADRLVAVTRALVSACAVPYREVLLAEPTELWPARWRVVFEHLERSGVRFARLEANLPGAPPHTDLGRLQAVLHGRAEGERVSVEGDGSLIKVTAETAWEAARATAALFPPTAHPTVVIRQHDAASLDNALDAHGLRTQGQSSLSAWRSALQVLPLALELAFEPKDPYRVLELLTLPVGPFQGRAGHELARALCQSPGIGSPAWEAAKGTLAASTPQALSAITSWLEGTGADPVDGAAKADLIAVVERVRSWCLARVASSSDDGTLLTAAQQCKTLLSALACDPRGKLRLVEARKLFASVMSVGTALNILEEQAGRADHVGSPAMLWAARDTIVWWAFEHPAELSHRLPWRRQELEALRAAGVRFPDPRALFAEEAHAARRAFGSATRQLILVGARNAAGKSLGAHPLWDELLARTGLDMAALARLEASARDLRDPGARLARPLVAHQPIQLPGGRAQWSVEAGSVPQLAELSFQSLDALLGCPLRWGLRYAAGVRPGGHALPSLVQLNGSLGHRLVEVLHQQGAFDLSEAELRAQAALVLTELFRREGAPLLRAGMAFERSQLQQQLVAAVVDLARILTEGGLRIAAVEHPIAVAHADYSLGGRIDLVVLDRDGRPAIIDMKWGAASYRDALEQGLALQLALYAIAYATERGQAALPDASYFSLKQGKLFGLASSVLPNGEVLEGPSLADTWQRALRTLAHTRRSLEGGRFPVSGTRRAPALLAVYGVGEDQQAAHFAYPAEASCKYCGFDSVCGRRWEATS